MACRAERSLCELAHSLVVVVYFFLAFFSAFLSALRCLSCAARSSLRRRFMRRRSSPPSPSSFRSAELSASSSAPSTPRAANAPACRSSPSPSPDTHCQTCTPYHSQHNAHATGKTDHVRSGLGTYRGLASLFIFIGCHVHEIQPADRRK